MDVAPTTSKGNDNINTYFQQIFSLTWRFASFLEQSII